MTDSKSTASRSRFFSNTVALVVQTIVATLVTLLQVKILSNFLTKETFGLFASLRGFSLLLAMLAANGMPQLLIRFIPQHEARGNRLKGLRLGVTGLLVTTALVAVLGLATYAWRDAVFGFAEPRVLGGWFFFWFYATTLGVGLKLILYGGLNGLRRLTTQVSLELVSLVAILVWIAVDRHTLTLERLFMILGVVHLATIAVGVPGFVLQSIRPAAAGAPDVTDARDGLGADSRPPGYGGYMMWAAGLSLVALAFTDVDRYVLAQVLSLEVLALFHIGSRVNRLAHRLLAVPNLAFQPEITRLGSEGRNERVVESTKIFMKFNVLVAMVLALALVTFARDIIVIVANENYLDAVTFLIILAVGLPLTTMTAPITTVMKALDQVREALLCDLAWAGVYIALIFALGRPFGLTGVAFAHLLASLAQLIAATSMSNLRPLGFGFVARQLVKLFLATAAAFSPLILSSVLIRSGAGWMLLGLKVVLLVGGVFVLLRLLRRLSVFSGEERASLHKMFDERGLGFVGRLF